MAAIAAQSPAKQLAGFIDKYDPTVAKLTRSLRSAMQKRLPTANQLVYDNYQFLAIGFSPTERTSDAIFSLAVSPKGVSLYFLYGATLPDPDKILRGTGSRGRSIPLEGPATLERPEVKRLMKAAIDHARSPLPKTGKGKLIIKSVSAKQRPRR